MIAEHGQAQHKFETMSRRLGQLRDGSTAAAQHIVYCLMWCDDVAGLESSHYVHEAVEKTRAALLAVQIDLESSIFSLESAQLRANNAARLIAHHASTSTGADHEVQ